MTDQEGNYLRITVQGNDILKKVKNYIKENKEMFMKILMELNTSITTVEDTDIRKNYTLNSLNPHEIKLNNCCLNQYKLSIYLMNLNLWIRKE